MIAGVEDLEKRDAGGDEGEIRGGEAAARGEGGGKGGLERYRITSLPSDFYYIPDFISVEEEESILAKVSSHMPHHTIHIYLRIDKKKKQSKKTKKPISYNRFPLNAGSPSPTDVSKPTPPPSPKTTPSSPPPSRNG